MQNRRMFFSIMLFPALIVLFLLIAVPLGYLFRNSLTAWELIEPNSDYFIGFTNYVAVLTDPEFWHSVRISLFFISITVGCQLIFGLIFAELTRKLFKGKNLVRTLMLLPMLVPPIIAGVIWRILYHPSLGLINSVLSIIGVQKAWLSDPNTALLAISLVTIWEWTPFIILVLAAAYSTIPKELEEAVRVDGGGWIHDFIYVRFLLIKPAIVAVLLFRIIDGLKVYPTIYIMTGGGPGTATETMNFYIYRHGLSHSRIGFSSAAGILMLILALSLSLLVFRLMKMNKNSSVSG